MGDGLKAPAGPEALQNLGIRWHRSTKRGGKLLESASLAEDKQRGGGGGGRAE